MKRIQIGLLPSATRNDMLYNLLQDIGEVTYLTPTERKAHYDIIVLPDNMGISPNLPCFTLKETSRIPVSFIDPTIEVFRTYALPFYLEKNIIIIGLGDNACLLYNELGGKVVVTSYGNQLVKGDFDNKYILGKSDTFINGFHYGCLVGLVDYKPTIASLLFQLKLEIQNEMQMDTKRITDQENTETDGEPTPSAPVDPMPAGRSRRNVN